jgi:hypothetical protein
LALCIGFWLPSRDGKRVGRKVVAIDDISLEEIPWKDDLPIAKYIYEPIANSWKGQGIPEQCLPLQREVDRLADNLAEQERRFAWCKWIVRKSDDIDPDSLIGNATVETNENPPVAMDGIAPPKQLYDQLERKGQQVLMRVGISANQAQGSTPEGIDAGIAILASAQIDDTRHIGPAQRLEGFVEQLGKLIIQAAGRYKPPVYHNGKQMDWPEVALDQKKTRIAAFKMSGLPQSIPGRKQELASMLENEEIDKTTYRRALGTNSVRPVANAITASDDYAIYQLDRIIETGKFQPPVPFMNMERTLEIAQARWLTEARNGIPQDRLMLLAQYVSMCAERVEELTSAVPAQQQIQQPADPAVQQPAGQPMPPPPQQPT